MSVTLREAMQDGGASFSKLVTVTIIAASPDTETNFMLVQKSTSAAGSALFDNAELVAVATPEDMVSYETTEIYPGYYRTNQATFCFPDSVKKQEAISSLITELSIAVSAFRLSLSPTASFAKSSVSSVSATPYYSDIYP